MLIGAIHMDNVVTKTGKNIIIIIIIVRLKDTPEPIWI